MRAGKKPCSASDVRCAPRSKSPIPRRWPRPSSAPRWIALGVHFPLLSAGSKRRWAESQRSSGEKRIGNRPGSRVLLGATARWSATAARGAALEKLTTKLVQRFFGGACKNDLGLLPFPPCLQLLHRFPRLLGAGMQVADGLLRLRLAEQQRTPFGNVGRYFRHRLEAIARRRCRSPARPDGAPASLEDAPSMDHAGGLAFSTSGSNPRPLTEAAILEHEGGARAGDPCKDRGRHTRSDGRGLPDAAQM